MNKVITIFLFFFVCCQIGCDSNNDTSSSSNENVSLTITNKSIDDDTDRHIASLSVPLADLYDLNDAATTEIDAYGVALTFTISTAKDYQEDSNSPLLFIAHNFLETRGYGTQIGVLNIKNGSSRGFNFGYEVDLKGSVYVFLIKNGSLIEQPIDVNIDVDGETVGQINLDTDAHSLSDTMIKEQILSCESMDSNGFIRFDFESALEDSLLMPTFVLWEYSDDHNPFAYCSELIFDGEQLKNDYASLSTDKTITSGEAKILYFLLYKP